MQVCSIVANVAIHVQHQLLPAVAKSHQLAIVHLHVHLALAFFLASMTACMLTMPIAVHQHQAVVVKHQLQAVDAKQLLAVIHVHQLADLTTSEH
jgi:hypothetical protein